MLRQNFSACHPIRHPSIIQHHKLLLDHKKEQAFVIMEYCPFPSLESVQRGYIGKAEIAGIMRSLLEAVSHLHENGICHRDLKLENILYEKSSGKAKVIDMGISKHMINMQTGEKEKMWSATGTLHYKAPEMLEGGEYDEKVDMWALGIIAYQLYYGKHPFDAEFKAALVERVISE